MIDKLNGKKFVICVNNEGNEASLVRWKVYQCIPDKTAEKHKEIRVIDEEGEGYLYSEDCFSSVQLESSVANTFIAEYAS